MSNTLWSKQDRRAVLLLTHGYPAAALLIGEAVAGLILWSGDSKTAGAVSVAAMTLTGLLARLGRLAAPAAIAGVGIISPSPSDDAAQGPPEERHREAGHQDPHLAEPSAHDRTRGLAPVETPSADSPPGGV